MDWSRAKTIFIVTFLLLNFFLIYQLMEKQTESDLKLLYLANLPEKLAEHHIEVATNDPEQIRTASPITGSAKQFSKEILLEQFDGQQIDVLNDTLIYSILETPYKLSDQNIESSVQYFLENFVIYGKEYVLSKVDLEAGRIGLHQAFEGNTIEYFEEARYHLILDINEELEIEAYHQLYMDITQHGREQEMLSQLKVVEILFNEQLIPVNTVIDQMELSYYSLLELSGDFHIFGPMWKVHVNDRYYYVNAINGAIQPINEMEG